MCSLAYPFYFLHSLQVEPNCAKYIPDYLYSAVVVLVSKRVGTGKRGG